MSDIKQQVESAIKVLDDKSFGIYFFTLDTKGNPTAGIANIYEHVKVLRELGYDAKILHEKNDYHGVQDWLGQEYAELPHVSIENDANLTGTDFIIIPEIFANVMDQVKGFPCKKIVFSQSYHYILDMLGIGKRWTDFGFNDVITTSDKQASYINQLFPTMNTHTVPVSIPDYFKPTDKMKLPIVSIVARDQQAALRIVKAFYLQYPAYKFITFRDLRGLPRQTFAEELGKSCLAIWVDETAGFGTFPLECFESDTPVIGKIPNMIPEWMEESVNGDEVIVKNNGVWTNNELSIPELVATYMKVWLEDSVPTNLLETMKESKGQYTSEAQVEKIKEVYGGLVESRKAEYTAMLPKEEETKAE